MVRVAGSGVAVNNRPAEPGAVELLPALWLK